MLSNSDNFYDSLSPAMQDILSIHIIMQTSGIDKTTYRRASFNTQYEYFEEIYETYFNLFNEKYKRARFSEGDLLKIEWLVIEKHYDGQNTKDEVIIPFGSLENLKSIELRNIKFSSLRQIIYNVYLESIVINDCSVESISGIENLSNLKSLDLTGNLIKEVGDIVGLKHLTKVNLSSNLIEDVTWELLPTGLEELNLQGNKISSMMSVSKLPNLTNLCLASNPIEDIFDIDKLKNLHELNIVDTKLNKLRELFDINIRYLYLERNAFDEAELKSLEKNKDIIINPEESYRAMLEMD